MYLLLKIGMTLSSRTTEKLKETVLIGLFSDVKLFVKYISLWWEQNTLFQPVNQIKWLSLIMFTVYPCKYYR